MRDVSARRMIFVEEGDRLVAVSLNAISCIRPGATSEHVTTVRLLGGEGVVTGESIQDLVSRVETGESYPRGYAKRVAEEEVDDGDAA